MTAKRRFFFRKDRLFVLGVAFVLVLGSSVVGDSLQQKPAYAVDLPNWDDVQAAKENEAATAEKVRQVEGLLKKVKDQQQALEAEAETASQRSVQAQQKFEEADSRAKALESQASAKKEEAAKAAEAAASIVSQMYRSGGVDSNVKLFLNDDEKSSAELLNRLSVLAKATERNTEISQAATQAHNTAVALEAQAAKAAGEREKFFNIAKQELDVAARAVENNRTKQIEAEQNQKVLEAQLAALRDTTTATVAGYQERLRQEEEDRQRAIAAAAAAAAARRQESAPSNGGGSAPPDTGGDWGYPLAPGTYSISCAYLCYQGHRGIDLAADVGTPIYAATSGTVSYAGWYGGGGNAVLLDNGGGVQTRYFHMVSAPVVGYGQRVGKGQILGYVGSTGFSTGPHLHFETRVYGDPNNPYYFMRDRGVGL
ncbi:peptidoglycan DD-metalloendopeptidase family protein [Canibacter sp. lx-45]|uniref:M23 family metallopeptidase n=1 Tax=Canibacter zhuwentaonis TaxID=2837491 RepID=UPI001BDC11F6|nr:M23 family metallopeptidase [Canibacter zhuwentaonis]MBT1035531.1 peptidoglycan DD-metalloendopeptidase family protein [Canibacter zhuwentaonis]